MNIDRESAATEASPGSERLFGAVMGWTVFTTVFAWLPIMRAVAKPEGYHWGIFGLSGEGLDGPFAVFPIMAFYSIAMFSYAWYPRVVFRVLLGVWHLAWTTLLIVGTLAGGADARWQGQGWGFNVPMLIPALVFIALTVLVFRWIVTDWRRGGETPPPAWTAWNTKRLVAGLLLAPVAFFLFRAGTNYNWVTALAILVTIFQWVTFSESFRPSTRTEANAM